MFRKVLLGLTVVVAIGSTALVFAQFRGPQPGQGRRPPRRGGPGGAPVVQLPSVTDTDVSGNFLYVLTDEWVHQIRLGQAPTLRQSANVSEALREVQGGQVTIGSDARLRVSEAGDVLVMTNGALVVYDLRLTRAQVRPLAPALREAAQVEQRARAAQQRGPNR